MKNLKQKVIKKIKWEQTMMQKINFLPSEKHRQNAMKIGKILVCQDSISDSQETRWEWMVYVDFQRHAILSGNDAIEVMDVLLNGSKNALESYLKTKS